MPTEIEIPARLMMFDDIPKSRIIRKLNRIAIGSVTATTNALPDVPHHQQDGDRADDQLFLDRAADGLDAPCGSAACGRRTGRSARPRAGPAWRVVIFSLTRRVTSSGFSP